MFIRISRSIKKLYRSLFPSFIMYLKSEVGPSGTLLDLGCGNDSPAKFLDAEFKVGVDIYDPYIKESKKRKLHNAYMLADVTKLEFKRKSFDTVLALDIIEHLNKEDAVKLIKKMESWAKKKIVIYTPNGFLHQEEYDNNPFQIHKSGWSVDELRAMGFKVHGIHGLKFLRKEMAGIRFKPEFFWKIISDITQRITYHFPELAFQLLAIKELE